MMGGEPDEEERVTVSPTEEASVIGISIDHDPESLATDEEYTFPRNDALMRAPGASVPIRFQGCEC